MQFQTPVVTEITAPNNVPFAPGNNVAGLGSDVPPELVTAGYVNALVFYSSTWNPLNTTPTIKFRFIATDPVTGDLILGYGLVNNPSVSQTAVVTTGLDIGTGVGANEVVAPSSSPFTAGNNVIGMGTTLPPEMIAAGYTVGVVFYSSTWNPLNTTPTIKFRFVSINNTSGDLILGYGICANPSVSQTAVVTTGLDLNLQGIVAPGGATFAPGNNVIGLGAQLPPELTAAGYVDAIVFYSTSWNPAATTFTIKFRFVTVLNNDLIFGYGYCVNPSVSQVATVVAAFVIKLNIGLSDNSIIANYVSGNKMFAVTAVSGTTQLTINGDGLSNAILLANSGNSGFLQLGSSLSGSNSFLEMNDNFKMIGNNGSVSVRVTDGTQTNPGVLVSAFGFDWTALPLVNGWTGDATRIPLYRMMPDGTVQMKGYIFKAANPVNGEQWMNALPAIASPLHTWSFLTATPGRPANTGQIVEIHSDGTGIIYDMAALSGSISLDSVRFAVI